MRREEEPDASFGGKGFRTHYLRMAEKRLFRRAVFYGRSQRVLVPIIPRADAEASREP